MDHDTAGQALDRWISVHQHQIRLITRIDFGFKSAEALIALALPSSAATDPRSQPK